MRLLTVGLVMLAGGGGGYWCHDFLEEGRQENRILLLQQQWVELDARQQSMVACWSYVQRINCEQRDEIRVLRACLEDAQWRISDLYGALECQEAARHED